MIITSENSSAWVQNLNFEEETEKKRLLTMEMAFWRRSTGRSRLERGHNETIRETLNAKKKYTDN